MLVDLTIKVSTKKSFDTSEQARLVALGHLGTHFDVMNKDFPLEFTQRNGLVIDVSHVQDRDIEVNDIDLNIVSPNMFVAFSTGYIEKVGYGTKEYLTNHPQLSVELIEQLLNLEVSIIGVDFSGVRRGKEHTPMDQYCADRGVFIVENLCNLSHLLQGKRFNVFKANTYPINFADMTGLPCRVVAEI